MPIWRWCSWRDESRCALLIWLVAIIWRRRAICFWSRRWRGIWGSSTYERRGYFCCARAVTISPNAYLNQCHLSIFSNASSQIWFRSVSKPLHSWISQRSVRPCVLNRSHVSTRKSHRWCRSWCSAERWVVLVGVVIVDCWGCIQGKPRDPFARCSWTMLIIISMQ